MSESRNKDAGYRSTLNLPRTDFPMKANLAQREPEVIQKWEEKGLYAARLKKNGGRPKFILHDGPPYANGNIHFGHILNKILKDMIVRYKNMSGYCSPFIPGWDCHGLPIEHQVDKDLGARKKGMGKLEIRKACREYAGKFVEIQKGEFRRLGCLADWDRPYLTMDPVYEAAIAREFGRFVEQGDIYKGLRPVLWCPHCRTALAEAEVEYEEKESPSIYVRFPLEPAGGVIRDLFPNLAGKKVSVAIWTTTPWTLPANLAVALHENYDYVAVPFGDEVLILAKHLVSAFSKLISHEEPEPLYRFSGRKLEHAICRHPFLSRTSKVVLSDHVSIDTGTGCVHIAPGHGAEDYEIGLRYGLRPLTPVDALGQLTDEAGVPEWKGVPVLKANPMIIERLRVEGNLLFDEKIRHMYPHCWRCKNPVLFRATEQWFLSLSKNSLRAKALDAVRRVEWMPKWGRERIYGMIENRPDWCLSRQRSWGVPIVAFRCRACNEFLLDRKIVDGIANRFEKEGGADLWFAETAENLLPEGTACPKCQSKDWQKEEDILDVWFDSGVSFAAVLEKNPSLAFPADLYLEGSDQHRGWFHSSLLASVGTRRQAPYRQVLTHGFVVDSHGKKYSKSAGNYIPPDKVLKENGAEILRLWVAAEEYRNDIRVSSEIFNRLIEAYRKIRNTCRFLLGNLYDFKVDSQAPSKKSNLSNDLDMWAMHGLQKLVSRVREAYEAFDFHVIFHELNRYCTVDLSAIYLDILKDRLYTSAPNDPARREAQRTLFSMATTLSRLMAPILSFTAEEIWQFVPAFPGKEESVHLADFPSPETEWIDESLAGRWDNFFRVRDEVLKALERARAAKRIGNSLEAKLVFIASQDPLKVLQGFEASLVDLLQVSQVEFADEGSEGGGEDAFQSEVIPTLAIDVLKADGQKCERCWRWSVEVGRFPDHPSLCGKCHRAIISL